MKKPVTMNGDLYGLEQLIRALSKGYFLDFSEYHAGAAGQPQYDEALKAGGNTALKKKK